MFANGSDQSYVCDLSAPRSSDNSVRWFVFCNERYKWQQNGKCSQLCASILRKHNNVAGSEMQHAAKVKNLNLVCRRWKEIAHYCAGGRKQHYKCEYSASNDPLVFTWWSKFGLTFFDPDRNNPKSICGSIQLQCVCTNGVWSHSNGSLER